MGCECCAWLERGLPLTVCQGQSGGAELVGQNEESHRERPQRPGDQRLSLANVEGGTSGARVWPCGSAQDRSTLRLTARICPPPLTRRPDVQISQPGVQDRTGGFDRTWQNQEPIPQCRRRKLNLRLSLLCHCLPALIIILPAAFRSLTPILRLDRIKLLHRPLRRLARHRRLAPTDHRPCRRCAHRASEIIQHRRLGETRRSEAIEPSQMTVE